MKYKDAMVAYNGDSNQIEVGPHPDHTGWSDEYMFTVGGCYVSTKKAQGPVARLKVYVDFHHAIVRDGVDIAAAHREFMKIDEYRECLAEDCVEIIGYKAGA